VGSRGERGTYQRAVHATGPAPLLEQFPFLIKGFHADNGSEYMNHHTEEFLNGLMLRLTKSCSGHSNGNVLAESKNSKKILSCARPLATSISRNNMLRNL